MSDNAIRSSRASAPAGPRLRADEIFTPSAPVTRRDLFAGRAPALAALESAVARPGRHAIVFGEPGAGKTSLVSMLASPAGPARAVTLVAVRPGETFGAVWSRAAEQMRLAVARAERGLAQPPHAAPAGAAWTPEATVTLAERATANGPAVVVFDDFENLSAAGERATMAAILGALVTLVPALTVVVSGTAGTADALLPDAGEWACAVHVSRLSPGECREALARAARRLDLDFDEEVAARIATLSKGLPGAVHALGLGAARAAGRAGESRVTNAQLLEAVNGCVAGAAPQVAHAYEQATVRARRGIYPEILLACALAPRDAHGTFSIADVRRALQDIVRREVRGLTNQVAALTEEGRGAVVEKRGLAGAARYRFVDPALEPYILMRGLEDGWATRGAPVWLPGATGGDALRLAA